MLNQEKLAEYYNNICSPLIFVNETLINENIPAKVYLYNFTAVDELSNFKKVFQEYLIYYIKNYDTIEYLSLPTDVNEISKYLITKGKRIRSNIILPQRLIRMNGLYGELFNDYYLRNICNNSRFNAYISKRNYESGNNENKGFDNVFCEVIDNKLEVVLSEAKFLSNLSATNALVTDTDHVDLEYINNYMYIVLQKQAELIPERNEVINNIVRELNNLVEDEGKSFIEALNLLNGSIKFVYFAIFTNTERNIVKYEQKIIKIINEFNNKIIATGINNYNIEVVFIPTFNQSMSLKNEMEDWT